MKVNETCSDVDAASRAVITNAGAGEYFTHRLGHGLGLEMHVSNLLGGIFPTSENSGVVYSLDMFQESTTPEILSQPPWKIIPTPKFYHIRQY